MLVDFELVRAQPLFGIDVPSGTLDEPAPVIVRKFQWCKRKCNPSCDSRRPQEARGSGQWGPAHRTGPNASLLHYRRRYDIPTHNPASTKQIYSSRPGGLLTTLRFADLWAYWMKRNFPIDDD